MRALIAAGVVLVFLTIPVSAQPPLPCEDELAAGGVLIRHLETSQHSLARAIAGRDKEIRRLQQRDAQLVAEIEKLKKPPPADTPQ